MNRQAVSSLVLLLALALLATGCGGRSATAAEKPAPYRLAYHSRPDLQPPATTFLVHDGGAAQGDIFLGAKGRSSQPGGPLILDGNGNVVWFDPVQPQEVTDFRVQRYRGRPVLTWWQGRQNKIGVGAGSYVIADTSYRTIATVKALGADGDLHEFQLTPHGTALVTAYKLVHRDLTAFGGPKNGPVYDSIVEEIDVASGKLLFRWDSLDHVPLAATELPATAKKATTKAPFDYFHVNAVSTDGPGRLLVSGRNVNAIYEIRRSDGKILWQIGGRHSSFAMGKGTHFALQHDARRQPDGTITVFDNDAAPKFAPYSRALVLRVDVAAKRVTLVKAYVHPRRLSVPYEGSMQPLPNGDVLVGWGGLPRFTEFGPTGKVVLDATFHVGDSYRVFKFPWHAQPSTRPDVAARRDGGGTDVWASWNGATEVASWRLLTGGDEVALDAADPVRKVGFETELHVSGHPKLVAVEALDAAGRVLARSPAVKPAG
jgi:hypothetical protein